MKHSCKNLTFRIYLSLSLSLCFIVSALSQNTQFITGINLSSANLTPLEASRWQHFGAMANTQSISLVQIGALSTAALAGGSFTFQMPGATTSIQAQGRFIQQTSNVDYVWWANLANDRGYFGIASNSAGKVAYAQIDGQNYMMYLLSNRYNALVKVNTASNTLLKKCLPQLTPPDDITFNENCDIDNDCSAVVSVLVLVTPEALNWLGGNYTPLESTLYFGLGLNTVNFAFLNSGMYHKSVRFIVEPYNFNYSGTPLIASDILLLLNDKAAHARRNATRADLMFLLTDSRYFPYAGATYIGGVNPPYLGIVSMEYLSGPSFTFAHELGHAFLLNHNRVSNQGDINYDGEECPFGWRFHNAAGIARTTIMVLSKPEDTIPGARILLNYSNPNIIFEGLATGTPTDFNARQASHSLCNVDDYFFDAELGVNISGPQFICEETATYTANITPPGTGVPGVGPYNIRWGVCDREFPTTSHPLVPLGSSATLSMQSGNLPSPVFWLFVSVISADGVFMNDIIKVDNPCGIPTPLIGGSISFVEKEAPISNAQVFELAPNPANQTLHVKLLGQKQDTQSKYSIFSSLGDLVCRGIVESAAQQNFEIDLSKYRLPDGLYYFYLNVDTFSGVQKFIIHN